MRNDNSIELIEIKEDIQILRNKGYSWLVDQLLDVENYTRKGRLNLSKIARKVNKDYLSVERARVACKSILLGESEAKAISK